MTDEGIELILTVMEAKELIGPANADKFDTFVRIYMVPDESGALQTKVKMKKKKNGQRKLELNFNVFFLSITDFRCSGTPRVQATTKHSHFG